MIKRISLIMAALMIMCIALSGCVNSPSVIQEEIYALDTIIKFSVYSKDKEAVFKAKQEIYNLESILSVNNAEGDIGRINSSPDTWVNVSETCFNLIKESLQVSSLTNGSFDITVYPAVKLWGFTESEYKVPSEKELREALGCIDYSKVLLDEENTSVYVPKGTSIDLGGIAKGYIADRVADIFTSEGVTSALLDFGGNIRLIGAKPDDSKWKIGVKSPDSSSAYFASIKAADVTVSTSGGYERNFEENGKVYHHILNPSTASPAESDLLSSTVIGKSGMVCDALSTALFVTGSKGIENIAKSYPEYSFILLQEDAVYVSQSLSQDFELSEEYKDIDIIII